MNSIDRDEMERLAWRLADRGVAGLERELADVARDARRAGVRPVAADVLTDRSAPEVARIRAFALVAAALDAQPHHAVATAA